MVDKGIFAILTAKDGMEGDLTACVEVYQDNDLKLEFQILKGDNTPFYLGSSFYDSPWKVKMIIKRSIEDADIDAVITKQAVLTEAANGKVEFTFEPSDFSAMIEGDYTYDLELTHDAPQKHYTILRSTFKILAK